METFLLIAIIILGLGVVWLSWFIGWIFRPKEK